MVKGLIGRFHGTKVVPKLGIPNREYVENKISIVEHKSVLISDVKNPIFLICECGYLM